VNPSDKVRPLRFESEVPIINAGLIQQATDELDTPPFVARRIRGIEPDQSLQKLNLADWDLHRLDNTALDHLPVKSRKQGIGDA
jgi:hypothetical protein